MSTTEGLIMAEVWTEQDEATYRPLRNKLLRIQARARRDKTRKRRYSVHKKPATNGVH